MARILGLDYGHVRLGVALSDPLKMIATAQGYIDVKKQNVLQELIKLINDHECEEIVVGLPLNQKGEDTKKSLEVKEFVSILKKYIAIPINFWNEGLSSYAADNIMAEGKIKLKQRKEKRDSFAAQVILQDYLDSKAGNN